VTDPGNDLHAAGLQRAADGDLLAVHRDRDPGQVRRCGLAGARGRHACSADHHGRGGRADGVCGGRLAGGQAARRRATLWQRVAHAANRTSPRHPAPSTTTPPAMSSQDRLRSVGADHRGRPPPGPGARRKGSGCLANFGDRQPGDRLTAHPDFSMAIYRPARYRDDNRLDMVTATARS
jgi:hypothetical protein